MTMLDPPLPFGSNVPLNGPRGDIELFGQFSGCLIPQSLNSGGHEIVSIMDVVKVEAVDLRALVAAQVLPNLAR